MSKAADWKAIEQDYRAGIKTLRVIAQEHGLTHAAIAKRAKRDGWERDLSERIRAKAAALVSKSAVSSAVTKADETAVVTANANLQASVLLSQRGDLTGSRKLVAQLFAELKAVSTGEVQAALEMLYDEAFDAASDAGKKALARAWAAAMELPGRAATVQKLTASLVSLIDAERTAFNIDDRTKGENEVVAGLKRLAALPG